MSYPALRQKHESFTRLYSAHLRGHTICEIPGKTILKGEAILETTENLLRTARAGGYAIGAFNVYNLEGAQAVISAAEALGSPVMLQLHPGSLEHGGRPLVALCLATAREAQVPVAVHLDHSASEGAIRLALESGLTSVMADGSELEYEGNLVFSRNMAGLVHGRGGFVEAELGRLSGTEDDLTVPENLAKLTDPDQAARFVAQSGIDALAVCIGNAHGRYKTEPVLDFERLDAIGRSVDIPLVLHGASGLSPSTVRRCIELGVCKLNVNTEVRAAYLNSLKLDLASPNSPDLVALMGNAVSAMQKVVEGKLRLFGFIENV